MADILDSLKALAFFVVGYFGMVMSYGIIVPMMDTLMGMTFIAEALGCTAPEIANNTCTITNTFEGLGWIGLWLIWVLACIAGPYYYIYESSRKQPDPRESKMLKVLQTVLFVLFGLAFTSMAWWLAPNAAAFLQSDFQKGVFWVGLIGVWIGVMLLAPIQSITNIYDRT